MDEDSPIRRRRRIFLRPGGRLCLATWQPLAANEWLTLPGEALRGFADVSDPEAGVPGMFGQADPDQVAANLRAAGYGEPRLDPVRLRLTFGADLDDATDYLTGTGLARTAFEAVAPDRRADALAALRTALTAHAGTDGGVRLGAAIWIVTATAGDG